MPQPQKTLYQTVRSSYLEIYQKVNVQKLCKYSQRMTFEKFIGNNFTDLRPVENSLETVRVAVPLNNIVKSLLFNTICLVAIHFKESYS